MKRKVLSTLWTLMLLFGGSFSSVYALSSYLSTFNNTYGTSGTTLNTCTLCHIPPGQSVNNLNPYASAFLNAGANAAALAAIANLDSDGDGFTNIAEINARTFPGDATSHPSASDTTLPIVTSFIIPASATSLTVPITAFTATDDVGVTGYMLTQTSSKPAAAASGWTATAPTSYTFSTGGTKTLYAWAKDAAGNVSDSVFDTIALTVNTQILWRNTSTGVNAVWYMNGVNQTGWGQPPTLADPNWTIAGTADFNGDGKPDILWRNVSTGVNAVWYMNGVNMTGVGQIPTVADVNWKIVGTGDFNNDGKPDILWRNTSTGVNAVWYMNGVNMTGVGQIPKVADVNWTITGTADFNGDGKPDILWRNTSTGVNAVWYMNGVNQTGWAQIPTVADPNWKIVGTGDSNNDGYADIIWRNSATGANMVWYMNGVTNTGSANLAPIPDLNWKIVGAY